MYYTEAVIYAWNLTESLVYTVHSWPLDVSYSGCIVRTTEEHSAVNILLSAGT